LAISRREGKKKGKRDKKEMQESRQVTIIPGTLAVTVLVLRRGERKRK